LIGGEFCSYIKPETGFWKVSGCDNNWDKHFALCRRLASTNPPQQPPQRVLPTQPVPTGNGAPLECPDKWLPVNVRRRFQMI